ncbi:nucleotide sugar dehydrogenase [Magnetospirillum sp. SS-4]|uniref:nucleotide sugar dehydrogenase n=1 Tax=Magnetospirillum sp. SS-4 TaxID=2681465 RepID=UPI00137FFFA4|nr:nucleotide sugar dehydrogenase [Magnetospirillum sp. SS-4]CAA7620037.1 UDP-glucose dehydrogenase [Magnetospirillum sp. SS-4]
MSDLPPSFSDRRVCVVGLGYVGLTLAATLAEVGFTVFGIEIRADVVEALNRGEPHFHEPNLAEVLGRVMKAGRLSIHRDIPADCDATVYFVTVGTPLDADGNPRLDMVDGTVRQIAAHYRPGALIIMRSTVRLGVTRELVLPILSATGKEYGLCFCPERTVEGQALQELRHLPQIVGGGDMAAAVRAAQLFQFITPTVVRVSSLEAAEMIKLIDNVHRDVMFGFVNEVARLCDTSGVNVAEVISAGKLGYGRTNLPMPGPVGGPCLTKDPYILMDGIRGRGEEAAITAAARAENERQLPRSAEFLAGTAARIGTPSSPVITLLGLAFKGRPATDDLRGTTARPILDRLVQLFPTARIRGYDAVVSAADIAAFGIEPCASLEEAFAGSHLMMILNNHPVFSGMPINSLAARTARPCFIYDLWNNFSARGLMLPKGVGYGSLGCHVDAVLPQA